MLLKIKTKKMNLKFWTWGKNNPENKQEDKKSGGEVLQPAEPQPAEPQPAEPPKPTTRKCVMQLILVNNKTDKEYVINSQNDFGLKWSFIDKKSNYNNDYLIVNQRQSIDDNDGVSLGRFADFSIINCVFKTFDIVADEKKES